MATSHKGHRFSRGRRFTHPSTEEDEWSRSSRRSRREGGCGSEGAMWMWICYHKFGIWHDFRCSYQPNGDFNDEQGFQQTIVQNLGIGAKNGGLKPNMGICRMGYGIGRYNQHQPAISNSFVQNQVLKLWVKSWEALMAGDFQDLNISEIMHKLRGRSLWPGSQKWKAMGLSKNSVETQQILMLNHSVSH